MNRRRIAIFFVAVLLAGIPSVVTAQSRRQSTLVIGGDFSDLITLDPAVSYEFSGTLITNNLYERLVRFEGDDLSQIVPGLAETWEVAAGPEGGSTITFHLRDASFSTGRPVTAADVVYSFDRAIEIGGPSSFLFTDVAGLEVGSTVAVDDRTVTLALPPRVNPSIVLNLLTFNIGGIVDATEVRSHEAAGDHGSAWLNDNSAGSGPFTLDRWDRSAQVVLVANPHYPDSGSIERVILREMKESSAQRTALESAEIDIAWDYTPEAFTAAANNPRLNALQTDTFQMTYMGMNSGPGAPFEDNRIRQAIRHAIDQDGIINELLGGLGRKMQTIVPFGLMGADTTVYHERDVERARQLLSEAGVGDGLTVELMVGTGACGGGVPCADLAAKIQSDLAEVGITANIRQLVSAELFNIYRAQGAELVVAGWSPDYPDPDGNATPLSSYDANSIAWRNAWRNDDASRLSSEAAAETDMARRAQLYGELTALVAQEGPYAMLYQPYKGIVTRAEVQGFVRSAQGDVDFSRISKTN
jgi:peptide/nickel transport system substrate-binding protein